MRFEIIKNNTLPFPLRDFPFRENAHSQRGKAAKAKQIFATILIILASISVSAQNVETVLSEIESNNTTLRA